MSTFLCKFISGCADCQAAKVNMHPTVLRLSPLAVENPFSFSSISVDLFTGLPDSHSFDSVMVMIDHGLMKGVIYCPCTKPLMLQELHNSFSPMFSLNLDSTPR